MIDLLQHCVKSLCGRAKRTLFTVLSISIGVGSVVLISSLGATGIGLIQTELDHLGLEGVVIAADSKLTGYRLENKVCTALAQLDDVSCAAGLSLETGNIRMHGLISNAVVWGVGKDYSKALSLPLLYGRHMDESELQAGKAVCLIDAKSAKEFYRRENIVGKTLSLEHNGTKQDFTIIGVVEAGGSGLQNVLGEFIPSFLYIPAPKLQEMTGKIGYSQISVSIKDSRTPDLALMMKTVENHTGMEKVFTIDNLSEQNKRLTGLLDRVSQTLSIIAAVSLVVAALGTMTVMLSSVKERTKEIGIKKSLGATNLRIMAEFLTESVVISCAGTAAGITAAAVLLKTAGKLFTAFPVKINGAATAAVICILLGVLFGIIPAVHAAKLDPVEALRNES